MEMCMIPVRARWVVCRNVELIAVAFSRTSPDECRIGFHGTLGKEQVRLDLQTMKMQVQMVVPMRDILRIWDLDLIT